MKNNSLLISVVMPTFNRLSSLKGVITALEQQSIDDNNFEVIVVSDGSTDGTNEFLAGYNNGLCLRPVYQQNAGPAEARNRGVQEAIGDIILFLDDDVVPAENLIEEHLAAHCQHQNERVVVIGPMLPPQNFHLSPWSKWMQERLLEQYNAMVSGDWEPTARQFYTGNASLSRLLLHEYGGFDPAFLRAEDVELAYRLADNGVRFVFWPQAEGFHYEHRSFSSWLNIAYSYGRNDVIFYRQKGQEWLLPNMYAEYQLRHPVIRLTVWMCLDQKRMMTMVTWMGKQLAIWGSKLKQDMVLRFACSTLFNLYHYQGVADELGGRTQFFAGRRSDK